MGCLILAGLAAAGLFGGLNWMLKNDAQVSGANWAIFIEKNLKAFDHILICEVGGHQGSHYGNKSTRKFFSDIFGVGVVFHADIYDPKGNRKFSTGLYDPLAGAGRTLESPKAHATPVSDAFVGSPGGRVSGDHDHDRDHDHLADHNHLTDHKPANMTLAKPDLALLHFPEDRAFIERAIATQTDITSVRTGDGLRHPHHYAVVHHLVYDHKRLVSVIRLFVDLDQRYATHLQVILMVLAMATIFFGVSFGVPMVRLVVLSKKKSEVDARAHFLAQHDSLTGLKNRWSFLHEARKIHEASLSTRRTYAVHYLDLDHFKQANDSLGHSIGDDLLREAARRMRYATGGEALIARMGGDEFAILQSGVGNPEEANRSGQAIINAFRDPFVLAEQKLSVAASIGTALFPSDDDDLDGLVKKADTALYWVKRTERGTHACYFAEMESDLLHRKRVEEQIRQALECDRLELHFQPQVSLMSGRVSGFEALVRMRDSDGNLIPPDEFIPIAEESDLICDIGDWVLRRAVEVASTWPGHLSVAVNISPPQFGREGFLRTISDTLQQFDFDPYRLEIEITEGLMFEDTERNSEILKEIGELGVSLSMDDFGTGYSSLSYLWRLPIDKIKIDRTFMRMSGDEVMNTSVILRTIIELAHRLDMTVVAEGVETVEQVCMMRSLNCDFIQGYFYSRPIPEIEVANYFLQQLRGGPDSIADVGSAGMADDRHSA